MANHTITCTKSTRNSNSPQESRPAWLGFSLAGVATRCTIITLFDFMPIVICTKQQVNTLWMRIGTVLSHLHFHYSMLKFLISSYHWKVFKIKYWKKMFASILSPVYFSEGFFKMYIVTTYTCGLVEILFTYNTLKRNHLCFESWKLETLYWNIYILKLEVIVMKSAYLKRKNLLSAKAFDCFSLQRECFQ